jgi:hypothetical protein
MAKEKIKVTLRPNNNVLADADHEFVLVKIEGDISVNVGVTEVLPGQCVSRKDAQTMVGSIRFHVRCIESKD